MNLCRLDVNWTFRNRLKWNSNENTKYFIHKDALYFILICISGARMCTCMCVCMCPCVSLCIWAYIYIIHVYANACVRMSLCKLIFKTSSWLSPLCYYSWLDILHFLFIIFIRLTCFILMLIIFTFVVFTMHTWQVRDEFNEDVYIYIYGYGCHLANGSITIMYTLHTCLISMGLRNGLLARYAKLRVRMRRECRERFPRHRR